MYTINQLQEKISQEIKEVNFQDKPATLYKPIKYTLDAGGKRIRPILVLAACNMFSDNIDNSVPVALAFEVFHNFTLLHDDIMDNSPIRRNKETVHVKWNDNTAILSGDAMMIKAYSFLTKLNADLLKKIFPVFNKTALEVCEGQQYDMDFENQNNVSEKEYLKMIKLKTSVLIAASLKAGAICGGASDKNANLLYDFGINIGLAFQLQDDLLDVYANEKEFGKKTGNDIISGKKTFLLINAFEKADAEISVKLKKLISDKKIEKQNKIKQVTALFNELNVKSITETKINEYHQNAKNSINLLSVNNRKKNILLNFTESIMKRNK